MGHSEKERLCVVACEQGWYVMLSFQVHVEHVERRVWHMLRRVAVVGGFKIVLDEVFV